MIHEKDVIARLRNIIDPLTQKDVITANIISGIVIKTDHIGLMITCSPEQLSARRALQPAIRDALLSFDHIVKVTPVLTSEAAAPASEPSARKKAVWNQTSVPHVTQIIAVASGKGGVGKSTITASMAVAAAISGLRVGIVDADIQGPSIPHMLGAPSGVKPELDDMSRMIPPLAGGVHIMSTALLLEAGQAAIMRGAMTSKTITQLVRAVAWGTPDAPLDLLLIDMPPGTGDVALSLLQNVPLKQHHGGMVLVTTPQQVAVIDAQKALQLCIKTSTPVLGVVENMSWFAAPDGQKQRLFGEGGGRQLAGEAHAPLLMQLPLNPALGSACDHGTLAQYLSTQPDMQRMLMDAVMHNAPS